MKTELLLLNVLVIIKIILPLPQGEPASDVSVPVTNFEEKIPNENIKLSTLSKTNQVKVFREINLVRILILKTIMIQGNNAKFDGSRFISNTIQLMEVYLYLNSMLQLFVTWNVSNYLKIVKKS